MCRGWLGVWCGAIFSSGLYVTVCRRADPGVTGPLKFRIAPESACPCVKNRPELQRWTPLDVPYRVLETISST